MRKLTKRIACGVLSAMMLSTLAVEGLVRGDADARANSAVNSTALADGVSFKNVTGQFDTSALMQENFNSSVIKAENLAPTYETRTVIVTLDKAPLTDRANGETVASYLDSFSGNLAQAEIRSEQNAFLKKLSKMGISYSYKGGYDAVLNGVAIEINTKHVSEIKKMSGVESVVITTAYSEPKTAEVDTSGVTTNETEVYKTGIYDSSEFVDAYGEGQVVAVLDTGLDYTHAAFQGFTKEGVELAWDQAYVKNILDSSSFELSAETRTSGKLSAKDVYVSDKVPFAFDYADDDPDVYPSYSNHGTHVAGIIGGYDVGGYTDKDGNPVSETFKGVVPDCQLVICKVFTDDLDDPDLGGAVSEDIVAALDDCVKLGVDVINMSLGTSCGFTSTNDGDDEGEMLNEVYDRIKQAGISLICAASNDYSAGYGGVYGTNLATNPDSGTVGSPSTYPAALSVASINGQKAGYFAANVDSEEDKAFVFYEEARDAEGNPYEFVKTLTEKYNKNEFEYVVVGGKGLASDYSLIKNLFKDSQGNSLNRIALIQRGDTTFQEKVEEAMKVGAIGVIVYNNVSGVIRMNLGEIDDPVPSVSLNMNAGKKLVDAAMNYTSEEIKAGKIKRVGTLTLSEEFVAGPFMSEFSSWGPTHDLKLKPEITAHGGEITSTVPGGYGEQSGTSMASPNMAGFMAVVRSYIEKDLHITDPVEINRLAMQLTMSTAGMVYDQDGLLYSPRKQGAGVAKLENVVGGTGAYLWTDVAENDYRPKLELGDDEEKTGVYEMQFKLTNFGDKELSFSVNHEAMTETLANDKMTVSEQAHMFEHSTTEWLVNGDKVDGVITAKAGATLDIKVTLTLDKTAIDYLEAADKKGNVYFENGMYVEGFLQLLSSTDGQCDLSIPFLAFYGDWEAAPMLDYSAFEVAQCAQDGSILEEDKIKASVWETLPYNTYYNEKYILPMGGYVYLVDENDDPVYVDEKYCAVSRYNEYYGEGSDDNYMSSTAIKAVYAGLLRNARLVKYKMINAATGELVKQDVIYRVSKAYTGGGNGVPANVEINLSPEEEQLVANGTYEMFFEFFQNEPEDVETAVAREEDTFSFSFTVDYEAPVLENARVRYYNYKVDGEEKQRIYLDFDIYDNHHAMAALLCYPVTEKVETENGEEEYETKLYLVTDYPTPIRNSNRNGTTSISIEITDAYEKYGKQLYLQIDDYAVNSCLYQIDIQKANSSILPESDQYSLAEGEENITLAMYEEHKVALNFADSYKGNADLSNFTWKSSNPKVVDVKNGVIVGLKKGTARVSVSNGGKGTPKYINVTVTDNTYEKLPSVPSISFGTVTTYLKSVKKAQGTVEVYAGETIDLTVEKDPWYHPMNDLRLVWSTSNASVATVDQNGVVTTLKKGTASITAAVERKRSDGSWESTLYATNVTFKVLNEFELGSPNILTAYNGPGYNAWVCPDCGEAWIAKEMVTKDGQANLCPNCLKVCQQSTDILKIPADLNIIYIYDEAFKENDNIKKIIIPSSVIEIRDLAFYQCEALEEVYFVSLNHREDGKGNILNPDIDWADLSMVYDGVFQECKNLKKVDFTNVKTITLGRDVFADCTSLSEVLDMPSIGTMNARAFKNTALTEVDLSGLHLSGENVFQGCNQIKSIKTGRFTALGDYMFAGCTSLTGVITIQTPKVGNGVFQNCTSLSGVVFTSNGAGYEFDIGENAFANCGTAAGEFTVEFGNENIRSIGDEAFARSAIKALDFSKIKGLQFIGDNVFGNTDLTEIVIGDNVDFGTLQILGAPFKGFTVKVAANCTEYVEENGAIYSSDKALLLYVNESVAGDSGVFTIPDTVTEIAPYAFAYNKKINKVIIPNSVETLGDYAFAYSAIKNVEWSKTGSRITAIPAGAFNGAALTGIVLPDSVVSVGDHAFAKSALTSFAADKLQSLGNNVFEACNSLTEITLCDGIKSMGDRVFASCLSLSVVTLPSVEKLGSFTFSGAESLKKVTFGADATTTGKYTFVKTSWQPDSYYYDYVGMPVEEVVFLGDKIQTIGEGTFYGCEKLTDLVLPASVTTMESYALANTKGLTSLNLENVEIFGDYAMFGSGVTELKLDSAKKVGTFAFAIDSETDTSVETAYTTLSMPAVEEIGNFAFYNSALTSVELPASLKKLGYGAFMSSAKLAEVKAAAENEYFFVEKGVLYRYIDKAAGTYELCLYPTALAGAGEAKARAYAIKEGTVSVLAYSFAELNKGVLDKVTLPYSVKTIGDSAFYASGVKEFTFESVTAPKLESVYRYEISAMIQMDESNAYYRGYYYTNFQTYIYDYSQYGKQKSDLTLNYPTNGTGYDNHIYGLFFGTKNQTGVVMDETTRECVTTIQAMHEDKAKIEAWKTMEKSDALVAEINEFSATVKTMRVYYNNAAASATQAQFITDEVTQMLTEVEGLLREVKQQFDIPIVAKELKVSANSTHKSEYKPGEVFDKTGLVAVIVYDDFSTVEITADELVAGASATNPLTKNSKQVEFTYNGLKLRVSVTMVEDKPIVPPVEDEDSSSEETQDSSVESNVESSASASESGCGSAMAASSAMFALLGVACVMVCKKKEN